MKTNPRRIATAFATFAALTTLAACISGPLTKTMGGSGSVSLEGPPGLWPSESPFDALETGDVAAFDWSWTSSDGVYGGMYLERSAETPYRVGSHGDVGEWEEGGWGLSVSIPGYVGPGNYTGDDVTMAFSWRAGATEEPTGELTFGDTLRIANAADCAAEVEEDGLSGSATCDAVTLERDNEELEGLHSLTIDWNADNTLWEEPTVYDE